MPTQYEKDFSINDRIYRVKRLPWGRPGDGKSFRHVIGIISSEIDTTLFRVLQGAPGDIPILEIVASLIGMIGKLNSPAFDKALDMMGKFTVAIASDQENAIALTGAAQANWWSWYPEDFFPWLQAALEVNVFDFLGGLKHTFPGEKIIAAQQKAIENKDVQAALAKYPEIAEIFPSLKSSAPQNIPTQDGGTPPSGGFGISPPTGSDPQPTSVNTGMP